MKSLLFASVSLFFVFALSLHAHADNWVHWRGPTGNGVANATPPTKWDANTNIKWKVPIAGKGSGSPIVWGKQDLRCNRCSNGQECGRGQPPNRVNEVVDSAVGHVLW